VIVLNYTILTSAGCLAKDETSFYTADELSVVVGFYSISDLIASTPQTFAVGDVITHGRFNRRTGANNIALLKVTHSLECLSKKRVLFTRLLHGG
jgi:hypothetical protein